MKRIGSLTSSPLRRSVLLGLVALGFVLAASTQAQIGFPYEAWWYTFDGGGAVSDDGGVRFSLTSSLGQYEAATHAGAPYELDGGYLTRGVTVNASAPDWQLLDR